MDGGVASYWNRFSPYCEPLDSCRRGDTMSVQNLSVTMFSNRFGRYPPLKKAFPCTGGSLRFGIQAPQSEIRIQFWYRHAYTWMRRFEHQVLVLQALHPTALADNRQDSTHIFV